MRILGNSGEGCPVTPQYLEFLMEVWNLDDRPLLNPNPEMR